MIREFILAGGILYLLIDGVQILDRPTISLQGVAVGFLLLVISGVFWFQEEESLRKWEYLFVWCAVLLFVGYGMLNFGGVL